MSYEDLLAQIFRELPVLKDQLHSPHVVYMKSQGKIYITFQSDVLVEEATFLKMEAILQKTFPMAPLALRVVSPSLKEDFFARIETYKPVLTDFLKRNYPSCVAWLPQIAWRANGNRITLTFPDSISMSYMGQKNIAGRLAQAVRDIFDAEAEVELSIAGDQEARIEQIRSTITEEDTHVYTLEELQKRNAASAAAVPQAPKKEPVKPIFGKKIVGTPMQMKDLTADTGLCIVEGDIFKLETKETKSGELLILTFAITDYSSSIPCKIFLRYRSRYAQKGETKDDSPITDAEKKAVTDKVEQLKIGMRVKVRGECLYDSFLRELSISVADLIPVEKETRKDTAEEKRVELHAHTSMSTMDALTPAGDLIGRAAKWGHPAIAITDHGVLQAFPDAFKAVKGKDIKLIPGCEGYLIDNGDPVTAPTDRPFSDAIIVLDFETTGLNTRQDRIIEIGAVKLVAGEIRDTMSVLVNPGRALPPKITEITGINDSMLRDAPSAAEALPKLLEFIGDAPIAAHNAAFDANIMKSELARLEIRREMPVLDTLTLSRKLLPELKSHKLGAVCKHLGVSLKNAHRAVHDAAATAQCLAKMLDTCREKGLSTLADLNTLKQGAIGESWHIILLAKSQEGLVNLNRLVSISHLDYFRRRPHMPKEVIAKYREGLIIGSACEAGEVYKAVLEGVDHDKLVKLASFYDYLEIQPNGNNAFLVREGRVESEDALRDINRKIVALADELGKPCVATGDVHFLDPEHAINRAIIQAGQGFDDCDNQPPLYFKTTNEMLEEFSYLGEEKCREVVIDNPRRIADMVDTLRLFPKHPTGADTFQPVWEDAADNIQNMTWSTARELYGDDLPEIVDARIRHELKSIVGYGFCTLYNIAQKLVARSLQDGYLVGSRGSVGSSLVARLCGITEVNALPPHYRCVRCHKGFFDVDTTRYKIGVDLPDRPCPICGENLTKDGYDIPFEVFLGFEGDKVPDIDLNFSGEFQNKAHHYVEELFGHDHVFRAGTISTLAEKTAYGYAAHYLEDKGIIAGNTEKERLAMGCQGVKRTTGQHPGGMVVVPKEYEIYQFTAVQHPADDLESDFTTTHFDFNSMHDILVKLDCLGHDDPTMMHMLEELTGINYKDVPLDDPAVRTLFSSPEALGVSRAQINCTTGTFGIPEFGTAFVRGMLDETKPTTMEELVRISGLSHGTDVWLGNAQSLIADGTAKLAECICCRDDIMNYLITMGVAKKMAFTTMEAVRKGKGLKPEMEQAMLEAKVPQWFIDSCKKVKYLFPKGHAVAYVMMSLRVAWFKVHRPHAYYCAYFTIRGDGFDAATMVADPETIRQRIHDLSHSEVKISAKEQQQLTCLELVLEMNMRGIRFLPVDLYKSEVTKFTIEDGNLRCPFTSLSGLGAAAAQPIIKARQDGPFISIEDLKDRAGLGSSVIELLRAHGSLQGLSATSQMSFF